MYRAINDFYSMAYLIFPFIQALGMLDSVSNAVLWALGMTPRIKFFLENQELKG